MRPWHILLPKVPTKTLTKSAKADRVQALLGSRSLRVTPFRKDLLKIFSESPNAISQAELLDRLGPFADRVTLYRNLQTLMEVGLIHEVVVSNQTICYAICLEHCESGEHRHQHLHFHCLQCQKTQCLEPLNSPPMPKIPKGFKVLEWQTEVKGYCSTCLNQTP
ncbi:MAG: transcriptional repressor [Sphingomonadales bacterium]|nr:transcriptional repressor [Sphingomonadales bacterium]